MQYEMIESETDVHNTHVPQMCVVWCGCGGVLWCRHLMYGGSSEVVSVDGALHVGETSNLVHAHCHTF